MASYLRQRSRSTTDTQTGIFQLSQDDLVFLRDNGYPGVDHMQVGCWYYQDGNKRLQGPYEDPNEALEAYEAHLQGKTP